MKRLILIVLLTAVSMQGELLAQGEYQSERVKQMNKSKTEQTFNAYLGMINIRDFVVLKEGSLILDLSDMSDYINFRNLDSLLTIFRNDIAFYKDSLSGNPTGSVRIDYVFNELYSFRKIRFKKYPSDGSIFLNKDGDISRLKFEQDTVRIIIQKSRLGIGHNNRPGLCTVPYSIQATFVLGNYYDIDKILADKVLGNIVDTLENFSGKKNTKKNRFPYPLTVIYNPYYSGEGSLVSFPVLMDNEYGVNGIKPKGKFFSVNASFGAGLVGNQISPMMDAGIQYNRYWRPGNFSDHNVYRLSASPYFFFNRDEKGDLVVQDNWFINIDVGEVDERNQYGWYGKAATFGVGYLALQKGDYFKGTTMKIFTDIIFIKGLTVVPELIFTNNFRQVFPGITVKVL